MPKLTPDVAVFPLMFQSLLDLWGVELLNAVTLSERCATGAGLTPDAWAHADCDARHRGCMGVGYSKEVRKQSLHSITKLRDERVARQVQLAEESRFEALPDIDSGSDAEKKEAEEWSFDKKGRKTFGPKVEYQFGGGVFPL